MSEYAEQKAIQALTLGKSVTYKSTYSPELLQPVPRQLNRDALALQGKNLPFHGNDIWNGYELSWLQPNGLPRIAILRCYIDAFSDNLIESKSFKLYLNSFNNSTFASEAAVREALYNDLSACANGDVHIEIIPPEEFHLLSFASLPGQCIDQQDITISEYALNPKLLNSKEQAGIVSETLHSNLLKSNCLVTNQPDWASVVIKYEGPQIDQAALLRYLISFREHNEFHEQCIERIFMDLTEYCACTKLTVYARYTRRGGLDINPFRSNFEEPVNDLRTPRQ